MADKIPDGTELRREITPDFGPKMYSVPTYRAEVNVGLRVGYDGADMDISDLLFRVRSYIDSQSAGNMFGCTVTKTSFVYPGGDEPGAVIGLINYPRYPVHPAVVRDRAIKLAIHLKEVCKQERVSVVTDEDTIMIGEL
jgi:hypothetical protein